MQTPHIAESSEQKSPLHDPSFTIKDFCDAEKISLAKYYALKRNGKGPKEMYLDGTIRISSAARRAWQQANENPPLEEQRLIEQRTKQRRENARRIGKLAAESPRHVSKKKRPA